MFKVKIVLALIILSQCSIVFSSVSNINEAIEIEYDIINESIHQLRYQTTLVKYYTVGDAALMTLNPSDENINTFVFIIGSNLQIKQDELLQKKYQEMNKLAAFLNTSKSGNLRDILNLFMSPNEAEHVIRGLMYMPQASFIKNITEFPELLLKQCVNILESMYLEDGIERLEKDFAAFADGTMSFHSIQQNYGKPKGSCNLLQTVMDQFYRLQVVNIPVADATDQELQELLRDQFALEQDMKNRAAVIKPRTVDDWLNFNKVKRYTKIVCQIRHVSFITQAITRELNERYALMQS